MRVAQTEDRFRTLLAADGSSDSPLEPASAAMRLFDFYENERVEDVDIDELCDTLFMEWGTYDWHDGRGLHFVYSLRRQFVLQGTSSDEADDGIWMLEVGFMRDPTQQTDLLGAGGESCLSLADLHDFRRLVAQHPATEFARSHVAATAYLTLQQGG